MNTVTYEHRKLTPSKIICVGRNYAAHIEELGNEVPDELVVFMKPNSALTDTLHAQHNGETLHYEAELAFLIESGQLSGVALGLDLTKRTLQSRLKDKQLPWERAKAFNGSLLLSPFVRLPPAIDKLNLTLSVNDTLRQQGGVSLMLHTPADILAEVSHFTHFEDGDVVMTGTPAGVGEVRAGDIFSGSVRDGSDLLVTANWIVA